MSTYRTDICPRRYTAALSVIMVGTWQVIFAIENNRSVMMVVTTTMIIIIMMIIIIIIMMTMDMI